MKLKDLETYLADYLQVAEIKDYCPKGLIVEGKEELKQGITGVTFSLELAKEAVKRNADFILVHHPHGFWDNQKPLIRGAHKQKLKLLLENDISLFGFHLPLDSHLEVGNNAVLTRALGMTVVDRFAGFAVIGELPEELPYEDFIAKVEKVVGKVNFNFPYGPRSVQRIGVCTGSYPEGVEELIQRGDVDAYLTGEARETTQYRVQEEGIHYIAAGHHQTERFGPRALGEHLAQKFDLAVEFVDLPNPV